MKNASNVLRAHFAGEIRKRNNPAPVILFLCLRKTRAEKSRDYRDAIVFENLHFKMFYAHTKTKSRRFQIFPALMGVFEKLRFRDRLVRTVGLTDTVFSNSSGEMWTRP